MKIKYLKNALYQDGQQMTPDDGFKVTKDHVLYYLNTWLEQELDKGCEALELEILDTYLFATKDDNQKQTKIKNTILNWESEWLPPTELLNLVSLTKQQYLLFVGSLANHYETEIEEWIEENVEELNEE